MIRDIAIEDDIARADQGAIEVSVLLDDGTQRWCYFMTPESLRNAGDWVPGSHTRYHAGSEHMIVVSEINAKVIVNLLTHLASSGSLLSCTRPFGERHSHG